MWAQGFRKRSPKLFKSTSRDPRKESQIQHRGRWVQKAPHGESAAVQSNPLHAQRFQVPRLWTQSSLPDLTPRARSSRVPRLAQNRACRNLQTNPLHPKSSKVQCLCTKSSPTELMEHRGTQSTQRDTALLSTQEMLRRAPLLHAPGARMTVVVLTYSYGLPIQRTAANML